MNERFSDRARHAMALANAEATRLRHNYLGPAHLMLGLIREGKSVATEALRVMDVNLEAVRRDVAADLTEGSDDSVGARAHSEELKEVIRRAIEEARQFNHRYVGTEHLVLGLLALPDSTPARALRKQGLNIDALRDRALGLLRGGVDAEHDLAHSRHGNFEWVHQHELAKAFRSTNFWHTMILAVDTANRLGAGEVEPQHLLLALLRDTSNGLSEVLTEKGITAEWLREKFNLPQ